MIPEEWVALAYGEGKAHQENSLKQEGELLLSLLIREGPAEGTV